MTRQHLVVGTAGHIDHGKSALIQALTGQDPDRLKEEKRRGITIELGFAELVLDDRFVVSFVDVPGHEKFIRHMVAGATGIDAVLLVVAADQGVQPQTREHLEICRLLGLERGLVALTKRDLVDAELCEVVELELRELLAETFLDDAPILSVSSRTGEGLDDLRTALTGLFEAGLSRSTSGIARLPVDRSFVMRGFGTVVTGTLVSGTLDDGDEIEVLPGGARGRVRGLQVHRESVPQAFAGQRTAVNLQGVATEDVPRGSTLTRPGELSTTRRVWARLTLLDAAPRDLRRGGPVRFHQGTSDRAARFRVLEEQSDGSLRAEIYLDEEAVLAPGDRFILRRPAPVDTVGGGTVVDVRPPRPRLASDEAFADRALETEHAIVLRLDRAGSAGAEPAKLAVELGLTLGQLELALAVLADEDAILRSGARVFDGQMWRELAEAVGRQLDVFHEHDPLATGLSREDLRTRVSRALPQEAWRQLLEQLAADGKLRLEGDRVARAGHTVVLAGPERELADRIERAFLDGGLEPPDAAEVAPDRRRPEVEKIVRLLVSQGALTRIHDGKLFHSRAIQQLIEKLEAFAAESATIDVAAFKQLAGVTRKHAIPLLEHLDATRVTRRVGNQRQILVRRGPS